MPTNPTTVTQAPIVIKNQIKSILQLYGGFDSGIGLFDALGVNIQAYSKQSCKCKQKQQCHNLISFLLFLINEKPIAANKNTIAHPKIYTNIGAILSFITVDKTVPPNINLDKSKQYFPICSFISQFYSKFMVQRYKNKMNYCLLAFCLFANFLSIISPTIAIQATKTQASIPTYIPVILCLFFIGYDLITNTGFRMFFRKEDIAVLINSNNHKGCSKNADNVYKDGKWVHDNMGFVLNFLSIAYKIKAPQISSIAQIAHINNPNLSTCLVMVPSTKTPAKMSFARSHSKSPALL
jgi:hypothetical protein